MIERGLPLVACVPAGAMRVTTARWACLLALVAGVGWCRAGACGEELVFNRDIRPILSNACFQCHGPDSAARKADLRLDVREAAVAAGAIDPEHPERSELLRRIRAEDPAERMPPVDSGKTLTAEEIARLEAWLRAGAPYQAHWAYLPVPAVVAVPQPEDPSRWCRNEIDAFVLAGLVRQGWQPAAEAPREQWLRRVTLDLTGLPPTLEEIDAFLADASADAYEKVVDRLLASPAYAERMAADWLDAARFADTFGYQADRDMHVWPWRDWVISSFQRNLPYDQFLIWQIAGDLLPSATREQRLATAFNRLHRQTNEGGSIEAEFRAEYVADRLRTMGTAILGLTLECARCHDHKYDPITQREYYQLAAFFNNIDEHGLYSHFTETAPTPALLLYEADQEARHQALREQIALAEQALAEAEQAARERFAAGGEEPLAVQPPEPAATYTFEEVQPAGDYRPVAGRVGQAIEFGGDDAYVCRGAGVFHRSSRFSFVLWVKPAVHQPRMVVLHRSRAAEDSAFRGYSLVLDEGHPTFSLVHFWPGNAISVRAAEVLSLGEWSHLAVTYDGSSHAAGVHIYLNGRPCTLEVVRDKLTRDIVHRPEWGDYDAGAVELSLGARFRDVGFKGGQVDELAVFADELSPLEVAALGGFAPPADQEARLAHYLRRHDAVWQQRRAALGALRTTEDDFVGQIRQIMVMEELSWRRPTYVLKRGAYDAPGEEVHPDTPAAILPFPGHLPRNRLGFALWLVDPQHPLTARVAVNRIWQIYFGRGLVATAEDFGIQGQPPSHPELLDWLARRFVQSGWNVHELCRLIALSSTYRQDSVPRDPSLYRLDPENRWLARGPHHRLSAEQLRDSALAASGLLVRKLGGPSVMPYQPAGLWEESGTGKTYQQSHGEGLYRRSLYTFWRRTSPPPSMTVFDAPSREVCQARRERTGTPLQSLVLLNDTQFVEVARVLAERLLQDGGATTNQHIETAFRLLAGRHPRADEADVLRQVYQEQYAAYAEQPELAAAYVSVGEAPRDTTLDVAAHAALTAVVQALLNYDAFVWKR